MPITPFLRGQAFEPETLKAMGRAYVKACHTLGLSDRDDPLNELIAKHVIRLAQMSVSGPETLYALTIKEFAAKAALLR